MYSLMLLVSLTSDGGAAAMVINSQEAAGLDC